MKTWHDSLLGYVGGDEQRRDGAEAMLLAQGREAGIKFDFNVMAQWQPVDSQRLLLWAGRYGKQVDMNSKAHSYTMANYCSSVKPHEPS